MLTDHIASERAPTLDLLRQLVEQPSIEGADSAIRCCLDIIHDLVAPIAQAIERPEFAGLPALVARFGDGLPARRVTFAGHIDVVPAMGAWSSPPFVLTPRGNRVIGRGVCDMKAGVAASVGAIRALAASGRLRDCAIELVVTGDEEVGSARGMCSLLAAGLVQGKMAICGEPTGLDVYLGNRGVGWYEIVIHGRGGHAGQLHTLASPITPALALCQAIQQMSFATKDDRFDPPTPSIAVTRLDAGAALHAINVVPDTVTIGIDRRLLPAESIDAATAEVHAIVQRTVHEPYRAEFLVPRRWPPCETPPDHLISRAAVAAVQAVGRSGRFGMDLAANDSSFLVEHGIPALLLGPGAPEQAHVTDESLDLDELYAAIAIYAEVALNCVGFDA